MDGGSKWPNRIASQEDLAREFRAQLAAVTGGLPPMTTPRLGGTGISTWRSHPRKQTEIAQSAFQAIADNFLSPHRRPRASRSRRASDDKRFAAEAWSQWPFNVMARGYLNWEQMVQQATSEVPGFSGRNADLVKFSSQQVLEAASPTNQLLANPELLELTRAQSGQNLVAGFKHWLEDADAMLNHKAPAASGEFKVGENIAVTPGQGGVSQRLDRTHSVRAEHAHCACRAHPDRAGVDHEVLHSRSVAEQFLGAVLGRQGPHGVHDLMEEPERAGPQFRHGRLLQPRHPRCTAGRQRHRAGRQDSRCRLLHRRNSCCRLRRLILRARAMIDWPR